VTNSLFTRTFQHKEKKNKNSFIDKYNINILVYCEPYQCIKDALIREKQMKKWSREWKIKLIEKKSDLEGFISGYTVIFIVVLLNPGFPPARE
jgi:putative endonuclease